MKNKRYIPALICLAALSVVALFVFRNFLVGTFVFLYKDIGSDSINIAYPGLVHIADYFRHWGIPGWSFSQGMGQWIYPFSMGDPFGVLLCCLGRTHIAFAIAWVEVLKILLAGMLFFAFLRTAAVPAAAAIIGAVCYAFSGFSVVGSCWSFSTTETAYFALLLLAVERLLRKGSLFLFPVWAALVAMFQPFYLFIYGLFLAFYLCMRFLLVRPIEPRRFAGTLVKIMLLGLLGCVMASVILIPDIAQMLSSPRAGNASYFKILASSHVFGFVDPQQLLTILYRLFSSDLIGTGSAFSGWNNYLEAPVFYCGLLNLVVAPQIFLIAGRRRGMVYAVSALLLALPLVFPHVRYALWLFSGNYYRALSLIESTCILLLGCQSLSWIIRRNGKCNIPLLLASASVLLLLLYIPPPANLAHVNNDLRNLAVLMILVYVFVLGMFGLGRLKGVFPFLLVVTVVFEACCFSYISVNDRRCVSGKELGEKTGYNDYSVDAIGWLRRTDADADAGFFRIDKTFGSGPAMHGSLNDAKVQDYYGTSSYSSFNQPSYIRFLDRMAVLSATDEAQTRWAQGLRSRPLLEAIASVKYILVRDTALPAASWCREPLGLFNNVAVLRNRFSLPLGFAYDSLIPMSLFRGLLPPVKDLTLLRAAVFDDADSALFSGLPRLSLPSPAAAPSMADLAARVARDISRRRLDTLDIRSFSQNRVAGSVTLSAKKLLFFSIPFDRGWHARVDGRPARLVTASIGFTGLMLDKGTHSVELCFRAPMLPWCAALSALGVALYFVFVFMQAARRRRKVDNV
jgi:uncharacterized membrane protein YfhO